MRSAPRRLTFQLVSLFDLLMIVIFAQYMDVQATARRQSEKVSKELDAARARMAEAERQRAAEAGFLAAGEEIQKLLTRDLEKIRTEHELLKADSERKQHELNQELKEAREDVVRIGNFIAELFRLPDDVRTEIVKLRSAEDAARIKEALRKLASKRGADMIRHVLSLDEFHKRCDIWELQIDDQNATTFSAGQVKTRFRADTPARFSAEIFKQYKNLPQPKSMVIILLSWSEADFWARTAAIKGLEQAVEKMQADSERRTRFEYGILGFIPTQ